MNSATRSLFATVLACGLARDATAHTRPVTRISLAGGIIELFVDGERMRFAINVDAVERSGLHLSSRLLGLAKIIRNGHAQ